MALEVWATDYSGVTRQLTPLGYRITNKLFGHARLELQVNSEGYSWTTNNLARTVQVKVTDTESGYSPFIGYMEKCEGGTWGSKPRLMTLYCVSNSKYLEDRTLWPRRLPAGMDIFDLFRDGSSTTSRNGLIWEANSLIPYGRWTLEPAYPNYTYSGAGLGSNHLWAHPDVYRDGIIMREDLGGLPLEGPDWYYQDYGQFLIQFAKKQDPFHYPMYLRNIRNTHIIRGASADLDTGRTTAGPMNINWRKTAWDFFRDVFISNNLEWGFRANTSDQLVLEWATNLSSLATYPATTISYDHDLIDYKVGFGRKMSTFLARGSDPADHSFYGDFFQGRVNGTYSVYREDLKTEPSYNAVQLANSAAWYGRHNAIYPYLVYAKAKSVFSLIPGSFIVLEVWEGPIYVTIYDITFNSNGIMEINGLARIY